MPAESMVTESFASLLCAGLIGILFGLALTFNGYRLFLVLLPIWGFIFGLGFGAHSIQALLGHGAFATVTSWVAGVVVGVVFAALSYLFYVAAVALLAGSLGYALGAGLLMAIGMDFGFLVWMVGIVAGIALAAAAIFLNLQKWIALIATAVLGAGVVVGTILMLFNPASTLMANPVKAAMGSNWLLTLLFLGLAIAGIVAQYRHNQRYTVVEYNRWEAMDAEPAG
jgi:hypothetical protein